MIQVRNNIFETNSSSTHCLTLMNHQMYDDWRNKKITVSVHYIYTDEEKDLNFGNEPDIKLPLNFNTTKQAKNISKEKYGNTTYDFRYHGLSYGDKGFMRTWGNFDTEASIVRSISVENQVEENVKLLYDYTHKDKWYMDYLKKADKYEYFMELIETYAKDGKFNEDMYKMFPNYLYFKDDEYIEMLRNDDCYSPFIHVYNDIVAFGFYFHS